MLGIIAGQQTISNQVCNHCSEIWDDIWWYDLKFTVLASCSNICHGVSWALRTDTTETRYTWCLH